MVCNLKTCVCFNYAIPQRVIVIVSLFLTMIAMFGTNACLMFTIDQIVVSTIDPSEEHNVCDNNVRNSDLQNGKFSWSYAEQKSISTAFLSGYLITLIPGGLLADNFGRRYLLLVGLLTSGIISIVTPSVISDENYFDFVVLRFFMGIAQGPTYPCVFSVLSDWIQRTERGFFGSLLFIGGPVGVALSYIVSLTLLKNCNWQSVYYFWGSFTLFWSIIYFLFCYSNPFTNPYISTEELAIIDTKIGKKQMLALPWKKFFKSSSVWGYLCGYTAFKTLHAFYIMLMPEYFYNIIKYDQKASMELIPILLYSVSSVTFGIVSDKLLTSDKLSVKKIRRIMSISGIIIPSIFLTAIPLVKCDKVSAYYLYLFGMIFLGSGNCGIRINILDISRNFVGTTLGIVSFVGNLIHAFLPNLIYASPQENIFQKWESGIIFAFFNVVILLALYCVMIKMQPQEWDGG